MSDMFEPLPGAKDGSANRAAEQDPWRVIVPVPESAPPAPLKHPKRGAPSATWTYRDADGKLLGYVLRFDPPAGKEFSPLTFCKNSATGAEVWRWKSWRVPRPLYGLDRLAQRPEAPVLVAEGEKSADAAGRLLSDYVAVTSPNGAESAGKADWSQLAGRTVVIWPDADLSGLGYADSVARALARLAASIILIEPTAAAKPGWDAADALASGWDQARAAAFIVANSRSRPTIAASSKVVKLDEAKRGQRAASQDSPALADQPWGERLILNDRRKAKPLLANAITVLTSHPDCAGRFRFDEFGNKSMILPGIPWIRTTTDRPVEDADDVAVAEWLQHLGLFVGPEIVRGAVEHVARMQRFHPVRAYLDDLKWDGRPRLDTWLTTFLGVAEAQYSRTVGACWMIGAMGRIYAPGAKVDTALILEGPQGARKSQALKALFDPWFSDSLPDLGTKDAAVALAGCWVFELAELEAMHKVELNRLKAFASRSTDRFRPPYGRRMIEQPRQCVFAGTVNLDTYLTDETGARRWWPVKCGVIDLDALRAAREQLLAEARTRYAAGAKWWISDLAVEVEASEEAAARYVEDPWDAPIGTYIAGKASVMVDEILGHAVDRPLAEWSKADANRVSKSLRHFGWLRHRVGPRGSRNYRWDPPPPSDAGDADEWSA